MAANKSTCTEGKQGFVEVLFTDGIQICGNYIGHGLIYDPEYDRIYNQHGPETVFGPVGIARASGYGPFFRETLKQFLSDPHQNPSGHEVRRFRIRLSCQGLRNARAFLEKEWDDSTEKTGYFLSDKIDMIYDSDGIPDRREGCSEALERTFREHTHLEKLTETLCSDTLSHQQTTRIREFNAFTHNCVTLFREALNQGGFYFDTSLINDANAAVEAFSTLPQTDVQFPKDAENILKLMSLREEDHTQPTVTKLPSY